jgi:hypothetical protein
MKNPIPIIIASVVLLLVVGTASRRSQDAPRQSASAQFVEVAVQFETTFSRSSRTWNSPCVFGTNSWMIEGEFALNAKTTWWCTDANTIEHTLITKKTASENGAPVGKSSEVGDEFVTMYDPYPYHNIPLEGLPYVNWLAFCSGSFLKTKGRELMPYYRSQSSGPYTDRTQSFRDGVGLPKQVKLYGKDDGNLMCVYEVLESTNFSGWTIPVRFTAIQYDNGNTSKPYSVISATVTSVREGTFPAVPPEILKKAGL